MKFITASFSSSHLHNHNKTNIISIIIILKGDHNDPARVQPALWHQAVLWRTDQLWRGGNKDDWQKYTAAVFLSTFIRLWQDRFPSVVAAWMVGSWTLTAGCIPLSKYLPILRSLPKYDYSTHVSHGPWFVCSIMCPIAPTWVTTFRSLGTGPVIFPRTRVIAANETTMVRSCITPTTSGSLSFSSVRSLFFSQISGAQLVEHKWKEKMLIFWSGSVGLHTAGGLALNGGRLDEVPGDVFRVEDVIEWLLCCNNCLEAIFW